MGNAMKDIGKQYPVDDDFKAAARRHQSRYRAQVLQVDYDEYGNRLTEIDARSLLNYYDGLGVRETLKSRYPNYSKIRDADMLRSEHIPFNLFAPLLRTDTLAEGIVHKAFGIEGNGPFVVEFEFAPQPKKLYLNDSTAFDGYIGFTSRDGRRIGIGIEVKYTEKEYPIGKTEKANVENSESRYWQVTRASSQFSDPADTQLGTDEMRQIWRNHLLGLSMCQRGELDTFFSITLYPEGNGHFRSAIPKYQSLLRPDSQGYAFGCTYEDFISAIDGDEEVRRWKEYLRERYVVVA